MVPDRPAGGRWNQAGHLKPKATGALGLAGAWALLGQLEDWCFGSAESGYAFGFWGLGFRVLTSLFGATQGV